MNNNSCYPCHGLILITSPVVVKIISIVSPDCDYPRLPDYPDCDYRLSFQLELKILGAVVQDDAILFYVNNRIITDLVALADDGGAYHRL